MDITPDQAALTAYIDRQIAQALATVEQIEQQRIEAGYREIQRRDGAAWWHARSWKHVGLVSQGVILALIGVVVYLALKQSQVQAFVQTVQVTDEGRLVQVGQPVDLFAYQPQDGEWITMLYSWVEKYRWRTGEKVRTTHDWNWLKDHTCGDGAKQLLRDEKGLDVYNPKKRHSLTISSVTKSDVPKSFQVVWSEITITEGAGGSDKPHSHTGVFTVARMRPKTMLKLVGNPLGQCVNGFSVSPGLTS